MEAFWAITLSAILIRLALRSKKPTQDELNRNTVKARWDRKRIKAEKQRHKDTELVTVILPTINNVILHRF